MRRRRTARTFAIVASIAAGLIAGCGSSSSPTNSTLTSTPAATGQATASIGGAKPVRIGVFLASSANSYFAANLQGIRQAASSAGDVTVTVFDGQFNANTQVNQLRDALVSHRFNAWLVAPVDGGSVAPEITQAVHDGISVGCILTPCGPNVASQTVQVPGITIQTGFGYVQNGRDLGRLTVQACASLNPCDVFWMPGNPQQPLESARQKGLYSVLKTDPKIKIVAVQAGGYLSSQGFTATQNVLQAHPNVNVIVSSGDQMIEGAYRAASLVGKLGQIKLLGDGCTIQSVALIKAGKVFACVANLPRTEGTIAATDVIRAVRGAKLRDVLVDPSKQSAVGVIITKANAGRFSPQFSS